MERSVAPYDGLEHTETALMDKLSTLASGTLAEDLESRFWLPVSLSLFTLQRLAVIQSEWDLSPEALEQELLARVSPAPKEIELTEEERPSSSWARWASMFFEACWEKNGDNFNS